MKRNALGLLMLFFFLAAVAGMTGCAMPQSFGSSSEAADSLVTAIRAGDRAQAMKILGDNAEDLLSSGDEVADRNRISQFLDLYNQKHELVNNDDGSVTLVVGNNDWPMPIPIVKEPWRE